MKGIQLTRNLRFLSMTDEKGDFGVVIAHSDDEVHNVYEVHSEEELRALIADSF